MNKSLPERYSRQILLPEIGESGQRKLSNSSVAVIGAGGLGSPVLLYLAAAGVGNIHIIDCDVVSESNLNRQILYNNSDIGKSKAVIAADIITRFNPLISVTSRNILITDTNAGELLAGYDSLVLCLDTIEARRTINRAAVKNNISYVEGAVSSFHGSIMTIIPGVTPCYECVFAHASQPQSAIPVVGAAAGIIGSMIAMAALRLMLGLSDPSRGSLVYVDCNSWENSVISVCRDINCPVCSNI